MLSAFLGVVMLPDLALALLLHEVKQDSGNGTFLRETSRSLAAKGGMPNESDGASYTFDIHSQLAEFACRCDSPDP